LRAALAIALALALARPALAFDDPDVEIAKRHYASGLAAYDAHDYPRALAEFEAARAAKAAPELTYNVARCLDRLERRPEAAQAYQDFLIAAPYSPSAKDVHERIAKLAARDHVGPVDARPSAPWRGRRYLPAIAVGATAVALAALGGGLLGGASHEYDAAVKSCGPSCNVGQSAGFVRLSGAAYASFALGGAAALVDVGLLIAAARHHD
jgi:tetratricopeptide (TPR) repeat protein